MKYENKLEKIYSQGEIEISFVNVPPNPFPAVKRSSNPGIAKTAKTVP